MRYDAIFFDLFDTVVHFDATRIPLDPLARDILDAVQAYSFRAVEPLLPELEFKAWRKTIRRNYIELEARKQASLEEIPAPERFAEIFTELGYEPHGAHAQAFQAGIESHFNLIHDCVTMPDSYREALQTLHREGIPLAIVSNFDYSPCLRRILETQRVTGYFEYVVVSMDLRLRKPHAELFQTAIRALDVAGQDQRLLHIGDNAHADVGGAAPLGIDTIWINPHKRDLPEGVPQPTAILHDISEVPAWLAGH